MREKLASVEAKRASLLRVAITTVKDIVQSLVEGWDETAEQLTYSLSSNRLLSNVLVTAEQDRDGICAARETDHYSKENRHRERVYTIKVCNAGEFATADRAR